MKTCHHSLSRFAESAVRRNKEPNHGSRELPSIAGLRKPTNKFYAPDSVTENVPVIVRIDIQSRSSGGILPFVLRQLVGKGA